MLQMVLSMKSLAGDLIPLKGVRNRKQWPRNAVREYFNIIERRMNASAAVTPASRQTRTKSGTHTRWLLMFVLQDIFWHFLEAPRVNVSKTRRMMVNLKSPQPRGKHVQQNAQLLGTSVTHLISIPIPKHVI